MASAGPNSAGTAANDATVGVDDWQFSLTSLQGDISASDNVYVTIGTGGSASKTSKYLKLTNFGFSIPSGATINGIVVEVEKKCSHNSALNYAKDSSVKLVKGGTIGGTSLADTVLKWSTTESYVTYGDASNLWGNTLTDTDVNASNFGVAFAANSQKSGKVNVIMYLDHIRITVYYTAGASFIAAQERPILQAVKRSNFY